MVEVTIAAVAAAEAEVVSATNMAVEEEAEVWATESPEKATGLVMGNNEIGRVRQKCVVLTVCIVVVPTIFLEEMSASNVMHQDLADQVTVVVEAAVAEVIEAVAVGIVVVVAVIVQTADETAMMTAQTADVITTVDEAVVMITVKITDMRDVIALTRRPIILNPTLPSENKIK